MQIRHCQHLERHEGEAFGDELVLRGAGERFAPVMTSVVLTALAFAPLAIAGRIAGLEIVQPMAVVVLGGFVSTTLLTLFVVPALYQRFGANSEPDLSLVFDEPTVDLTELEAGSPSSRPHRGGERDAARSSMDSGTPDPLPVWCCRHVRRCRRRRRRLNEPATLEAVDGSDVSRITLTAEAVERVDIQSESRARRRRDGCGDPLCRPVSTPRLRRHLDGTRLRSH